MAIVSIKDCGQGLNKDLMAEELVAGQWTDAANMRFRSGFAERFKGMQSLFADPLVVPYWVSPYASTLTRFWAHAGIAKMYVDDGTTRTEITRKTEGAGISSITRVGTTATLTTAAVHGRTTGDTVTVYNASPSQYNGTYVITVTTTTAFTYVIASDPGASASPVGNYALSTTGNFTGAIDDRWTGGSLNGVFICNNAIDQPQYWGGDVTVPLRVLPGWVSTHKVGWMRPFKNYILCGDVTKGSVRFPHMLKWSAVAVAGAVPSTWDISDATQDAAERDLAETPDLMVDGLPLGDAFIVYKERSMYSVTQTFDSRIFRTARLPGNSGMLARGCAVSTPMGHVVLTAGDLIVHMGQGVKSIISGRMRKWLFNTMSSTLSSRSFVTSNPQKNEVWVCFPSTDATSCDKALVWNWENETFGIRSLASVTYGDAGQVSTASATTAASFDTDVGTYDTDGTTYDENEYSANEARIVFSHLTKLSLVDTGTTDFGTAITSSLERTGMHFDDPYSIKLIKCVYPRITAVSGTVINVQVGSAMNPDSPVTWATAKSFTVGATGRIKVDSFSVAGRFLALRFNSTTNSIWRLRSCDLDIKKQGGY